MKPTAIVYSSNTGKTERYAHMLSDELSIPAYSISQAKKSLEKGTNIIYMGWLMAATVKDLPKANKRYNVSAVCGVGLCPTGEMLNEVRSAARIPDGVSLFIIYSTVIERSVVITAYNFHKTSPNAPLAHSIHFERSSGFTPRLGLICSSPSRHSR